MSNGALAQLAQAGVTILLTPEGNLRVRARRGYLTQDRLQAIESQKADLVRELRAVTLPEANDWTAADWRKHFDERVAIAEINGGLSRQRAEARVYEGCVTEWINQHPELSDPGLCAWCGRQDQSGHTVVPFGADGRGHTWLHPECWAQWYQDRRERAQAALSAMGITSGEGAA